MVLHPKKKILQGLNRLDKFKNKICYVIENNCLKMIIINKYKVETNYA